MHTQKSNRASLHRQTGRKLSKGIFVFHKSDAGEVDFLCFENVPIMAFERVPWYATEPFTNGVKNAGILILLTVLFWPVMAVCRRIYNAKDSEEESEVPEQPDNLPFCARMITSAAALIFLAFIIILLPAVTGDAALIQSYMFDRTTPPALAAALAVPVIAALLSVVGALFLVPIWKQQYWTRWHRVHYTIVIIGLLLLTWWVNYWNLFFFRV